jgi:hypothetical protein
VTTMTMTIKCGNCKAQHGTVAEVRACYGQTGPVAISRPATTAPAAQVAPAQATAKQVAFIERLVGERYEGGPTAIVPGHTYTLLERLFPVRTKAAASALIERLLAMPKAAPALASQATHPADKAPEGMHKIGDEIFKVQKAVHGSGHLYAKRLVAGEGYGSKARFVYAPGVLKVLTTDTLMTLDEAKAWGALYGTCCVCGRTLTNEDSIEAGIGPVCAGKF